ncbi:hypothetical protein [Bdellovibrio bacteriovorus]|uniref:hypothetical protein n=1 Tax=Bdellovibrio bacteriovorus TaxID=959 RepID=UPI0035A61F5C
MSQGNAFKKMVALSLPAFITACSGGGGADLTSNSLNISGILGGASLQSLSKVSAKAGDDVSSQEAVSVSDLEVYAEAFTADGMKSATASIGADGSFTISIPGAKGAPVTAIFRDKNTEAEIGVLVFEDSAKKDLNGNNSQSSSVVLEDSVALGSISLSSDGKVKVPVAQVADKLGSASDVSSGSAFDPTGTWYMKPFTGTLATGYQTVTADCSHGPCVNFPVTFVRYAGKEFTPTSNCSVTNGSLSGACASSDGTIGSADRYALSIWGGDFSQSIGACGSKAGFSADEARAFGRIHIPSLPTVSGNSITFGDYIFTKTGFGGDAAPFNQDWMKTGAQSNHPVHDCRPMTINSLYRGWACKSKVMSGQWPGTPTGQTKWMVNVEGGGCFSNGKPVNVTNWGNIGGSASCSQSSATGTYGAGFATNNCTYTNADHDNDSNTAAITFTCGGTHGFFDDNGGAPNMAAPATMNQGEYLGQPEELVAQGQACSSIGDATDSAKLAAYRCYAESYWSNQAGAGSCSREFRFNWAATTSAEFVVQDYRGKPKNAFVTNILNYAADGQSATLEDEQEETITLPTGLNSSTFCKVVRRTNITFKKVSATRLLLDLKEQGRMASTTAACQAAAKAALEGKTTGANMDLGEHLQPMRMLFYLDSSL